MVMSLCVEVPVGVSHEEVEGGPPADGGGDDFSIIETTPTSVHTQVYPQPYSQPFIATAIPSGYANSCRMTEVKQLGLWL
jgi:hypothetical protein